nr:hypothetical protein [Tanacetum cinerariifolium]
MDLFAFIHTHDPTKVKVVERERVKDEPLLLQTTVGCTVPLLSVAPDCADSELETSIDKLFDEGGSGSQAGQGDSAGVGEGTNIQPVTEATDIVTENVAPLQPKHCSHHSGANVAEAEVDSLVRYSASVMKTVTTNISMADPDMVAKEKTAKPFLFATGSSSAGGADPNAGVFQILPKVTSFSVVSTPMRAEYNIKEKGMLKSAVDEKNKLLKVREKEDEVKALKERNASLENERDALDVKVTGLEASAMGKDRELTDLNA